MLRDIVGKEHQGVADWLGRIALQAMLDGWHVQRGVDGVPLDARETIVSYRGGSFRLKIGMVAGLLVLMSGCSGLREIRYAVLGQSTEARIVNLYDVRLAGRSTHPHTAVVYQYDDAGERRQDSDEMPLGWRTESSMVRIEYLPGKDYSSRLAGHASRWAMYVFMGSALTAGCLAVWVIRDARGGGSTR